MHSTSKKMTRCEIFSRVVGYYRPVSQWNDGKQMEFKKRFSHYLKKGNKM